MIRMDDATPNLLRLRWDVGDVTAANFGRLALLQLSGSVRPLILTESFAGLANWPSSQDALALFNTPSAPFVLTDFSTSASNVEWRMRAHFSGGGQKSLLLSWSLVAGGRNHGGEAVIGGPL